MATEALLFQTGYLTIRNVEDRTGRTRYRLGYPNHEVRQSLNEHLLNALLPESSRRLAEGRPATRVARGKRLQGTGSHVPGRFRRHSAPMAYQPPHRGVRGLLRERVLFLLRGAGVRPHSGGEQRQRAGGHGVSGSTAACTCSSSRRWRRSRRGPRWRSSRRGATPTSTAISANPSI